MAGLRMGTPRINTFSGDATLGRKEGSYAQWYHKVKCVKDHYLEAVIWESITRLLKGAVADKARYVGPTASIDHILQNFQLFLAQWPPLTFSCRTSIRSPRVIMRRSPPLP